MLRLSTIATSPRYRRRTLAVLLTVIATGVVVGVPGHGQARGPATPAAAPGAPPASPPAAAPSALRPEAISGTYRFVGGAAEIAALDRAIDGVVQQMNFFIRGIARSRLRRPNLPTAELSIMVAGPRVTVTRPGRRGLTTPADGRRVPWTSTEGERFVVSQRLWPGFLVQRFEGAGGVSQNVYRLSPDGRTLTIETRITNRRLPAELRFQTTYRRL